MSQSHIGRIVSEETREKLRSPVVHGTYAGYIRGCRLEDCIEAMREYDRNRYKRRKEKKLSSSVTPI